MNLCVSTKTSLRCRRDAREQSLAGQTPADHVCVAYLEPLRAASSSKKGSSSIQGRLPAFDGRPLIDWTEVTTGQQSCWFPAKIAQSRNFACGRGMKQSLALVAAAAAAGWAVWRLLIPRKKVFRARRILVAEPSLTDLEEKYLIRAYRSDPSANLCAARSASVRAALRTRAHVHACMHVSVCVHRSTFISGGAGSFKDRLEKEFAAMCGCKFGVAVCNGTVAIDLVLLAAGLKPGDEVIVPSFTYVASVAAIVNAGGVPVFVDCDAASGLIDPAAGCWRAPAALPAFIVACPRRDQPATR